MSELPGKTAVPAGFKDELRRLLDRYPAAKLALFFAISFMTFSLVDALLPCGYWDYRGRTYGGHVAEIAWRSVAFSVMFFFVFKRRQPADRSMPPG